MSGGFWALWEAVDSTRRYLFSSDAAEGEEPASPVSGPAPAVRTAFGGRPRYTFQLTAGASARRAASSVMPGRRDGTGRVSAPVLRPAAGRTLRTLCAFVSRA